MILIYNDDSDDDDVIVMMVVMVMMIMMYGLLVCMFLCVDRYKYVCVHYQLLSPY